MHVSPHGFSHSPVQEVLTGITPTGYPPVSLTLSSPYPGWPVIRKKLGHLLDSLSGERGFHSCILRYTDVFLLQDGDVPYRLVQIAPPVPAGDWFQGLSGTSSEIHLKSIDNETWLSIRFREDMDRLVLVFEAVSKEGRTIGRSAILPWFDAAREDIHRLFDLVVSDELIHRLG